MIRTSLKNMQKCKGEKMSDLSSLALSSTHTLPIRHEGDVYSGKVRSVFWLKPSDSARLITSQSYDIHKDSQLGIMIISDRISAFDCIWRGEEGLMGVPGKGAALNAISYHWFQQFSQAGLGENHVLDVPHPLAWIVQRAEPIKIEAIARRHITGSMWRDYATGKREICGISIPEGLKEHQRLPELYITPSTKGILRGIPDVPEEEDVNIARKQIIDNYQAFGFLEISDILTYEQMLRKGFDLIEKGFASIDEVFVDTKFEFGYVRGNDGKRKIIYQDEVGTPDSSRSWDEKKYAEGKIVENSKEGFRQFLLGTLERDILLNKKRMEERKQLALNYRVPVDTMINVSNTYTNIAKRITGKTVQSKQNAEQEILDSLSSYGVLE